MSSLPDMLVCTHQSLNRCNQVRKACVLCDKLTSGNKNTQKEEMEKESMEGGGRTISYKSASITVEHELVSAISSTVAHIVQ